MSTRIKNLIGTWVSSKGNLWIVRKTHDRSNTFLNIEFRILTKYNPFGFNSDFIYGEKWHRYDSKSFEQDEIKRFNLVKMEVLS